MHCIHDISHTISEMAFTVSLSSQRLYLWSQTNSMYDITPTLQMPAYALYTTSHPLFMGPLLSSKGGSRPAGPVCTQGSLQQRLALSEVTAHHLGHITGPAHTQGEGTGQGPQHPQQHRGATCRSGHHTDNGGLYHHSELSTWKTTRK